MAGSSSNIPRAAPHVVLGRPLRHAEQGGAAPDASQAQNRGVLRRLRFVLREIARRARIAIHHGIVKRRVGSAAHYGGNSHATTKVTAKSDSTPMD